MLLLRTLTNHPPLHFRYLHRAVSKSGEPRLIYTAPNAITVRILKAFSISTLGVLGRICLDYVWIACSRPFQATDIGGYMFLGALVASSCSTAFLQYFVSPYITHLYLHTDTSPAARSDMPLSTTTPRPTAITPSTTVTLETLNLLARPVHTTLQLRDLRPTSKDMFLTWRVKRKAFEKEGQDRIGQTRFWLDYRGGEGDLETVEKMVRTVREEGSSRIIGGIAFNIQSFTITDSFNPRNSNLFISYSHVIYVHVLSTLVLGIPSSQYYMSSNALILPLLRLRLRLRQIHPRIPPPPQSETLAQILLNHSKE
ncbi:hypothetical protein BC936DRAFT_137611 [Jimgerdemannia flammicorona]|uniref:Uncharacterized protein n=1 Tax=Jimgerdemannia flammicorona TaxID=994334 RepID=A0A433DJ28_9FUNG|nr:hypothetical protein BC936DRAFT_137611 [Jimgerdemannia flammicorona]